MTRYHKQDVYRGWVIYWDSKNLEYKATLAGMALYGQSRVEIEREIDYAELHCR